MISANISANQTLYWSANNNATRQSMVVSIVLSLELFTVVYCLVFVLVIIIGWGIWRTNISQIAHLEAKQRKFGNRGEGYLEGLYWICAALGGCQLK